MFTRYAERRGFKTETMNASDGSYTFEIRGDGAYSVFKFEGGTHRVQRVPETESQGRIHTSTATVAVLPEAEEVDVQVDQNDLEIDVYRSSGPGGQSVNTTDSAVRITHKPTGIVVSMQDEKSQLQNRERAMKVLRARLYEAKLAEQQAELAAARSAQVGTGERAEKIRTYNFPERRVTDHRIKLTAHNLDQLLAGELDEFTAALQDDEKRRRSTLPSADRGASDGRAAAPHRVGPRVAGRPPRRCCGTRTTPESRRQMLTPIEQLTVPGPRFAREPGATGTGRRYALEGDARPGDVLALAGGALVYDANGNGLVDGYDAVLADGRPPLRHPHRPPRLMPAGSMSG